jgi:predicted ATPase
MFLVGPNASGKSNFIDIFRFLSDVVTVGGGFESAVRRRGGVSMLRSFAARRNPSVKIEVALGDESSPHEWSYELEFAQDNQRRPTIKSETVKRRGRLVLKRPEREDESDPERLRQTHLEQVNVNREFRDVADFFSTVRYLHIVPQLVREPDRSVGKVNDPFGGDFLEQIARTPKRVREARLRRIVAALRVAVPQLEELELQADVKGVAHLRGKYRHWRAQGAWQNEAHFSDGTLRLLGLLWAIVEGYGPLLLEEPELSLHPEVVRQIPQMFAQVQRRSGRQIVVSSHSVEMLADSGIGLDEFLMLMPTPEGTAVTLAKEIPDVVNMHQAGIDLAEIISTLTRPKEAARLSFLGS